MAFLDKLIGEIITDPVLPLCSVSDECRHRLFGNLAKCDKCTNHSKFKKVRNRDVQNIFDKIKEMR
jgi:hypothetical protein